MRLASLPGFPRGEQNRSQGGAEWGSERIVVRFRTAFRLYQRRAVRPAIFQVRQGRPMKPAHFRPRDTAPRLKAHSTTDTSVAILGAGFGGLCMAIKLLEAGHDDFTVFEKASSAGGT